MARPALARTGAALGCMGAKGSHERSRAGWQMGSERMDALSVPRTSIDRIRLACMHALWMNAIRVPKTREEAAY